MYSSVKIKAGRYLQQSQTKIVITSKDGQDGLEHIHALFDAYKKEVRSILELTVTVLNSNFTGKQFLDIEREFKRLLSKFY